ncbi:lytic transglycosylase domain-containing protein [Prochlorococcus sp. MIT 1341]|uniref:lytic transglycosylase domain-containing protein n=1 Tax=Prochlorococcus sp. MIT 1341 TaxID=3096221 RepID=UPI002A758B81|nr:lytic transglycosylase domain-containing protein [Prochlorococcus sp. MIT 1341]
MRGPLEHPFKALAAIVFLTLLTILGGQALVRSFQEKLNPNLSSSQLWEKYRWSLDPTQRRHAALLLVAASGDSPQRQYTLLKSQGWGKNPLAAIVLKKHAETARKLGGEPLAKVFWLELFRRFPLSPISADAYYILGRDEIDFRKKIMQLYPAHPASLAAALELKGQVANPYQGVKHLARWGVRWHGAEQLFRKTCDEFSGKLHLEKERELLANALAQLGDGLAAWKCLKEPPSKPAITFLIAKSLVQGDELNKELAKTLLKKLFVNHPNSKESIAGLKLLLRLKRLSVDEVAGLPSGLTNAAKSIAMANDRLSIDKKPLEGFQDWRDDSELWELHWELARQALLLEDWDKAQSLLSSFRYKNLPETILVRIKFWEGLIQFKKGKTFLANNIWVELIENHPPSYYTWRAHQRLGHITFPKLREIEPSNYLFSPISWTPLFSKDNLVNLLWRLGLEKTAWETWRALYFSEVDQLNHDFSETLVEARLRIAVGDSWMGLAMLSELAFEKTFVDCFQRNIFHRSQYPYRFMQEVSDAFKQTGVRPELLLAIANQESRFSPGVESSQGAIGLMQLMPLTAQKYIDSSFQGKYLAEPSINLEIGGHHLAALLEIWEGNPFLVLASYNAGSSIVYSWLSEEAYLDPELWVERIPYPETRFYTKKVLGNLWSYLTPDWTACRVKVD